MRQQRLAAFDIDQIDPDVFLSQPGFLMNTLGNGFVKSLFYLNRATGIPGDLDEHNVRRVTDPQIPRSRIDQLFLGMAVNDLKLVMLRYVSNVDHRLVNHITNGSGGLGRGI